MPEHQRFTGPGIVFADDSAVEDGLFYPARVSAHRRVAALTLSSER